MIIDAMDLLYTKNLEQTEKDEEKTETNANSKKSRNELRKDTALVKLLQTAVEQNADEDGWSHLGSVGQYISNKTSFAPVNYGYKKLNNHLSYTCSHKQVTEPPVYR